MKENSTFHSDLRKVLDEFVHEVYDVTVRFPKDEQFGITSQLRRASISVILNYIEGFARRRNSVLKNFLEISYGSLKEAQYLVEFSYKRKYLNKTECESIQKRVDRIGKMIWGILKNL